MNMNLNYQAKGDLFDFESLIGLTVEEAERALAAGGIEGSRVRATEVDGVPQVVTMDYDPNRLNVALEDSKISGMRNWG